jgi:hypothetical protein
LHDDEKESMGVPKKLEKSFPKLYFITKVIIYSLDNNEKETFMGSFPQVDPRYGKVLASRQVPRE